MAAWDCVNHSQGKDPGGQTTDHLTPKCNAGAHFAGSQAIWYSDCKGTLQKPQKWGEKLKRRLDLPDGNLPL